MNVSPKQSEQCQACLNIAATEKRRLKTSIYGLVGKKLSHSFSKEYFTKKFFSLGLNNCEYQNFEIENENDLPSVFDIPDLRGFNVTVPYKKAIIPLLDSCSSEAAAVGAVNTVSLENGKWVGYNTDVAGFEKSFMPLLCSLKHNATCVEITAADYVAADEVVSVSVNDIKQSRAMIFGTGGASNAVQYVLKKNGIPFLLVGRGHQNNVRYAELDISLMYSYNIFVNTTPVGMYPNIKDILPIPFDGIKQGSVVFDLIYNPVQTTFLQEASKRGAVIKNGLEMLHIQAEAAWEIFHLTENVAQRGK